MIRFNVMRKRNDQPVRFGLRGEKKLATFECESPEFTVIAGKLTPRFDIVVCEMIGNPLVIRQTHNKTTIRSRQLFARHFDFYQIKEGA